MTMPGVKKVDVDFGVVVQRQATLIGQLQSQTIMQQVALEEAHTEIARLSAMIPKDNDPEPSDEKPPAKRPGRTRAQGD